MRSPAPFICLAATAALTTALTAGCGTSPKPKPKPSTANTANAASTAPVAVSCKQLAPADLPDAAGQVAQTDSGSYCLGRDQLMDAFLTAPAKPATRDGGWSTIASSNPGVLATGDNSVVSTPIGVTFGAFVGRSAGTAVLSSTLPSGTKWSVTVIVH